MARSYRVSPEMTFSGLLFLTEIPGPHGADTGFGLTVTTAGGPLLSVSAMSGLCLKWVMCTLDPPQIGEALPL